MYAVCVSGTPFPYFRFKRHKKLTRAKMKQTNSSVDAWSDSSSRTSSRAQSMRNEIVQLGGVMGRSGPAFARVPITLKSPCLENSTKEATVSRRANLGLEVATRRESVALSPIFQHLRTQGPKVRYVLTSSIRVVIFAWKSVKGDVFAERTFAPRLLHE
jgi:hypothetical protein